MKSTNTDARAKSRVLSPDIWALGIGALGIGALGVCALGIGALPALAEPENMPAASATPAVRLLDISSATLSPATLSAVAVSPTLKARIVTRSLRLSNKPAGPGRTTTSTRGSGYKPKAVPLNGAMRGIKSVDEFIEKMPDWSYVNKLKKDKTVADNIPVDPKEDKAYKITRTKYSITETPVEIVSFAPVNGFYPGGIVQGEGLALGLGSIQEVSVPRAKRAPLVISTNLPTGNNFREIASPSATTVSSAIGDLMAKNNKAQWGSSATFTIKDNFNEEQVAMDLGIDASYMAAEIHGAFKSDRLKSKHSVAAAFVEKAFTAQADFEGRSRREAFFNSAFTVKDALALYQKGEIAPDNLPAYIKSVTYGRVMIFNLTSTLSSEEMRVAIDLAYKGAVVKAKSNNLFSSKAKAATFDLTVTAVGGPQGNFQSLVPGAGIEDVMAVMSDYLSRPAPLTTMVPISYTANTLREDKLAAMTKTTEYTVTKYTPNPIGERYKVKMWVSVTAIRDGAADNNYEVYGDLRVNGDTWWKIGAGEAKSNQRGRGETVLISEDSTHIVGGRDFTFDYFYDTKQLFTFEINLFDWDKVSSNDRWLNIKKTMNLSQYVGKEYAQPVGDGVVHILVERLDYL